MKHLMILSLLLATACAMPPVVAPHFLGSNADVSQLTGFWQAHIESEDKNIAGEIELHVAPNGELEIHGQHPLLWARINGNEIRATLEPYFDDTRRTNVYTTFEGSIQEDEMHGVVWERVSFQWVNAGSWSARRTEGSSWTHTRLPLSSR